MKIYIIRCEGHRQWSFSRIININDILETASARPLTGMMTELWPVLEVAGPKWPVWRPEREYWQDRYYVRLSDQKYEECVGVHDCPLGTPVVFQALLCWSLNYTSNISPLIISRPEQAEGPNTGEHQSSYKKGKFWYQEMCDQLNISDQQTLYHCEL